MPETTNEKFWVLSPLKNFPLCFTSMVYVSPSSTESISIFSTLSTSLSPRVAGSAGAAPFNFHGKKVLVPCLILMSRSFTNFLSLEFNAPFGVTGPAGSVHTMVALKGPFPDATTVTEKLESFFRFFSTTRLFSVLLRTDAALAILAKPNPFL